MVKDILQNLMLLLGGITVFLYGLRVMSDSVQTLCRGRMKGLIRRATDGRIKGVLVGCGVTAIIQSSTATNVMLVGLVNASVLSLSSALCVVMGANIGTTVTAQLVSLSGSTAFSVTAIASFIGFLGLLLSFFEGRKNKIGNAMIGFSLVFVGLEIMNGGVVAFKDYPFFKMLFTCYSPLLLILNGVLITGIVQSSSAVTSVMIILAANGLLSLEDSIFLTLGCNVGAGISVLIVSSSMTDEARQVAVGNILFNILGAAVFILPLLMWTDEICALFRTLNGQIERQVANFHTVFNVVSTLVILPFVKLFERLTVWVSKGISKKKKPRRYKPDH